jgi:hypothetical protein
MPYERSVKSPFTLTPFEIELLKLLDSGMTPGEISRQRGWKKKSGGMWTRCQVALEKRELLQLDDRKPQGHTLLGVARGAKRMDRTMFPYRGM